MTTLIIADPHEEIERLEAIIERFPADRVIVDGDYFDSFTQSMEDTIRIAKWVKAHLDDPKYTLLLGNHDIHYGFKNPWLKCSGYNLAKQAIISHILSPEDFRKMKLHSWADGGWLVCHAGIHPSFAHPIHGLDKAWINKLCRETLVELHAGECPDFLRAGRARRGPVEVGGITWCDWAQEFEASPGLNQIVGHSCGTLPRKKTLSDSRNYCIDTRMNTVIVMTDGEPVLTSAETSMLPDWMNT